MKKESVYFNGQLAGTIQEEPSGEISFTYDSKYLRDEQAPAISVSLPKQAEPFIKEGLPTFFDGLIPEGWLLTIAAEKLKLNPYRDRFDLLLATCQDTIGAVSIGKIVEKPEVKITTLESRNSLHQQWEQVSKKFTKCLYCYQPLKQGQETLYHQKCSTELFGTHQPPWLDFDESQIKKLAEQTINEKLAIPGVQKKLSLSLHKETSAHSKEGTKSYRMTVTNLWARYILKPRSHAPHLPENEHLAMLLAKSAGLKTANCGLLPLINGELAYISERFDRPKRKKTKYHMEDFCQILEKRPEQKYIGGIEQVAKKLREITQENAPEDNILRLFEWVVFSYLIGNADLHLKNISILWSPQPSLSPVYDVLCTSLWIPDDEQSALSILGKKNKLSADSFLGLAAHLGIKEKVVQNVYSSFQKSMPKWRTLIQQSFLTEDIKTKLITLIETRSEIIAHRKEE